ncbi:hypothetical protein GCM10028821_49070 [Hymenobacter jeollabukensis]
MNAGTGKALGFRCLYGLHFEVDAATARRRSDDQIYPGSLTGTGPLRGFSSAAYKAAALVFGNSLLNTAPR